MAKQNYNKLELTWIGKGEEPKLEPRILIENPEYSYGDPKSENMLIHGDNLLALKALEQDFTGKIKCIYIDPPYNTGNAFEHYDDGIEHSQWLNLITPRLKILKNLLTQDGTIWISIDDDESHYLKVLCDEIFGRQNFINNVIWEKKYSPQNDAKWLSDSHDHILVYAKNKAVWRPNLLPRTEDMDARYKNPDNDSRGKWKTSDLSVKRVTEKDIYEITTPSGRIVLPPKGRSWSVSRAKFEELLNDNRIWFGVNNDSVPQLKRFITDVKDGITAMTIWKYTDVGHNQDAKKEVIQFNSTNVFETPKPEKLIQRIIHLATNEGDFVLDSFLGSGTTAAVSHKLGRKWIVIELGEHAKTHCFPRLKAVVDGEQGGISSQVDWNGGGGFKFYNLAPSLLNEDKYGNWIISKEYNAQMLASAMAKQEGFKYEPDEHMYWKQGRSSERDFIFTTTQFITAEIIDKINEEMQPGESVLITCKSYQDGCESRHANISIKKIPHMLMGRCEFGKDDYSFNIVNMPRDEESENWVEPEVDSVKTSKKSKNIDSSPGLFDL
jgi:adenine-specific DNA-methyltransferase